MLLQHAALGLRRPPRTRTGAGHNYTGLQQMLPADSGTRHRKRFPLIRADFGGRRTEMGWKTEKAEGRVARGDAPICLCGRAAGSLPA